MYSLGVFEEHICFSKMQRKMRKNSGVKKKAVLVLKGTTWLYCDV